MTPDELLSLADNPDLIQGIYNYCDRWCERCPMTHRCLLYISTPDDESASKGPAEDRIQAMSRQIESSFTLTLDLLNRMAAEKGIDLQSPVDAESFMEEQEFQRREIQKSPPTQLAKQYLDSCRNWLDHCDAVFQAKDEELERMANLRLPDHDPVQEAETLKNALDVLYWYDFQINVKIVRAQSGRLRNNDGSDEDDDFSKDSDGSAKVALIGIDRSIGAWGILLQSLPDQEDSILHLLTLLERLRRMVEEDFPNARKFVRPGFDDLR